MRIAIALLGVGLLFGVAGCHKAERELPVTELPQKPMSADLDCEKATDAEIIACIKDPSVRDVCRKLETTCARYKDLQSFVHRTWAARDRQ
jgi:hypothetical protein